MTFLVKTINATEPDPIALDYIARTTGMTDECKTDIQFLIAELRQKNVLEHLDVLCIAGDADTTAHAEANALLNIIKDNHNAVIGAGTPTYTEDEGWDFNGTTEYIDSNFVAVSGVTKYDLNDCMFGAYARDAAVNVVMGMTDLISASSLLKISVAGLEVRANMQATVDVGKAYVSTIGAIAGTRASTGGHAVFTEAGSAFNSRSTTALNDTENVYIGCQNRTGSPGSFYTGAIGAWAIGSAPVRPQFFITALANYFTRRGTAV